MKNVMSTIPRPLSHGENTITNPYDISKQLVDLFNLSFSSDSFPSILETAKVVSVFKKGSKLDCCNYRPISLLSNVEKILYK